MNEGTSPRSDFYVYALFRDSGGVFYIGKGHGRRCFDHGQNARAGRRGRRFSIIRAMLARGAEMPIAKLHDGLTEAMAHAYEIALIAAIGRQPYGPLVNLTDGGDGAAGLIPTPEHRAKVSASLKGRPKSAEAVANMSTSHLGQKVSPETRVKLAAANLGKVHPPEVRAKISISGRGMKRSIQTGEHISAALKGRKPSSQCTAARLAAITATPLSAEHKAKLSQALLGVQRPLETKAKISAGLRGHQVSPATREKIAVALRAKAEAKRMAA